jgi:NTE family protein
VIWLPAGIVDAAISSSPALSRGLAERCAMRLTIAENPGPPRPRARVFTVLANDYETDVGSLAVALVEELARAGRAELLWDVRAQAQTTRWFAEIEEKNDYVVYVSDPQPNAWSRQCCRQADVLLLAARARSRPQPWPKELTAVAAHARVELALLHEGVTVPGAAKRWLDHVAVGQHHHIRDEADIPRVARLVTQRGVGLVLSGGGARGFAHLGVIAALREAHVPIDFVGGASIGSIVGAGLASGWSDAEMRERYRRSFVESNPLNDYTFPFVALSRGRKVTRLLQRAFGDTQIEDLGIPFACVSANLSTGRSHEHTRGPVWQALRASISIPGVLPPVFNGDDVLVDGAAINNLPVDVMREHAPGIVIGVDVGADRSFTAAATETHDPPFWRFFSRAPSGRRRINIFQILFRAGMVNSAGTAAAQRQLADVLLKPPLEDIDLLNWKAFDRAIEQGYHYAAAAIAENPLIPRLAAVKKAPRPANSLQALVEARYSAAAAR